MDGGGSSSHGSDQLKKALMDLGCLVDARSLKQVWSSIRDCGARLVENQSELKLSLDSPSKVTDMLDLLEFQGSLVMRKCYKDIRGIIERRVLTRKERNFLVLGSPGVGKSYFLLYMLIHLSTKAHTAVFLNTLQGGRYILFPGVEEAFEFKTFDDYNKALRLAAEHDGVFYQLYDAGTKGSKTDRILPRTNVVTIVASSPDTSNYQQFAKYKHSELYMEPWSYGELARANRLLNASLNEDTLRKRYALVGGIPRWVLDQSFDIEGKVCSAVRNASSEKIKKAWEDANEGIITATDSGISRKICQIVPKEDRASCSPIPAGMFAAYHIQAMVEMIDDREFRELFDTLGMVKTAGPFAGHAFEAYVHLMVKRGARNAAGSRFLPPHSDAPKSLNMWAGEQLEGQSFCCFHRVDELDEAAKRAKNSYWKATRHNFPSIDGFAVRENEGGLFVHFLQITMNKEGKDGAVNADDLQDYVDRITKGWNGERDKVFVCLWFVLPAHLYDSNAYRREQKLNEGTTDARSRLRLVQGVVKFDWTKVRGIPIRQMIDFWWSAVETEFMDRCKEYEEGYLGPRMST